MSSKNSIANANIFREYIGSKSATENYGGFPIDIIRPEISEFHFILAFAKEDYDPQTKKGKGNFRATWSATKFSVESIKRLKRDYKNVKVVISIGGRSTDTPAFNPENRDLWIENAKKSLKEIILDDYKSDHCGCHTVIDVIDIAYEGIQSDDFAHCIGKVIDDLKNIHGLLVSIAPSQPVLSHYKNLYKNKASDIRWVNYQYYLQKISTVHDFFNIHNNLIDTFHVEKLLAGFSTDPNDDGNISLQVFFDSCQKLIGTGSLPGIFVFDADNSQASELPFYVEKRAQNLLITGSD